MKKYFINCLFIAIFTIATNLHSQVIYTGLKKDYTQSMDSLLLNINKTPIITGILYDRIMSFSSLHMLKKNAIITKSDYQHFIQSWSELNRSSYSPIFSNIDNLKTNIASNINPSLIDLGIINTKMNYIDFGSPTQPTMNFVNGRFVNISGINPFLEKQVTVISPLKERVNSGTITFRVLPSFMLQLSGSAIKNLIANFGTATNYNLITNQVITTSNPVVSYSTSGLKEFTFTVTFADNTTETLKATMFVEVPPINSNSSQSLVTSYPLEENFVGTTGITTTSVGNVAFQGYNETTPSKGTSEYRTYYNTVTNNGSAASKIRKEIILLDGYDPTDSRKIYQQSAGYDSERSSLYELMSYDDDNNPSTLNVNLVQKLRAAPYGYDVTLVNFPNGADYIERNAMAVVSLLNRENAKLLANGSSEQISIIGPSMGGLISRYALAYMEKNNIPHNTKLWVSYDCPHLGANIPIGAQENLYFYGYNGRKDNAKVKFDENFRSPGARQMLIEQLDNKHESSPYPTTLWGNGSPNGQNNNTAFRQQFLSNLNSNGLLGSNGFPQNLRKVSLINGTATGAKTNGEGQMFLELAAFTIIKYGQIFGTSIETKIKVATIEDRFLATPNNWSQTFAGKVTIKRLGGIEVQSGTISRNNVNPKGSMDIVQGGMFNTQGIIKEQFTKVLNNEVDSQEWRQYAPNHAFIPSVSALAFKNPNFDWSTSFKRNLVCNPANKEIPFDSYFVPPTNEDHVKVTAENANWLIQELQGINQLPYFPMENNLLTGDNLICENQLKTYTINETCKVPGAPVWSVTGNLQIVSSTPFSVTVKGLPNAQSEGKIIATFHSFVGGQKIEKTIWVGKPILIDRSTNTTFCQGGGQREQNSITVSPLSSVASVSQYQWTMCEDPTIFPCLMTTDVSIIGSSNVNRAYFDVPVSTTGVSIFVRAKNSCGWSPWLDVSRNAQNCGATDPNCTQCWRSAPKSVYKVYPNPSKDIVNIDLREENNLPENGTRITGELFDIMGQSRSKVEIQNNKAIFSVLGLPRGIYVLKIYINDQVESHQIAVE